MKGFKINIEKDTLKNNFFRKVVYSGKHFQLVLMSLNVNEEIGERIHHENDQFFRFESGKGKCIVDNNVYLVKGGDVLIVPSGTKHNIINIDDKEELKMNTVYAPPHYKDGIIIGTKEDAKIFDAEFVETITEFVETITEVNKDELLISNRDKVQTDMFTVDLQ